MFLFLPQTWTLQCSVPWLLDVVVITPRLQTSDLTPGVQCAACDWPGRNVWARGGGQHHASWPRVGKSQHWCHADCFMDDLLLVTGYWFWNSDLTLLPHYSRTPTDRVAHVSAVFSTLLIVYMYFGQNQYKRTEHQKKFDTDNKSKEGVPNLWQDGIM